MAYYTLSNPFQYWNNPANSNPVGLGKLYVGLQDLDPVTPANRVTVKALTADGSEITLSQPIQLLAGGIPSYNGSPVQLLIEEETVSVRVNSLAGAQVFYTPRAKAPDAALRKDLADGTADVGGVTSAIVAAVVSSTVVFTNAAWGADPTGVLDNTAAFNSAYAYAKTIGGELYIPAGTYKGQFLINAEAAVRGAGKRRTKLTPVSTSYVVKVYGATGDTNLGAKLSSLSIDGVGKVGTGLYCGDPSGTGFSNGSISDLEIKGFNNNWFIAQAIVCEFSNIWTHDGTYGINFDNERNVTVCTFRNIRSTTNDYNCRMASGHVMTFLGCDFESAVVQNLSMFTGVTSGPTNVNFIGCWFEDITGASGSNRASVFLDMDPTKAGTKAMNVKFDRCVISSPNGIPDVKADNAQNVVFDTCNFSATADAYSATKLVYASGGNSVRIKLINCGKIQEMATEAMYASFPALTRVSGGVFGYFYEFTVRSGKLCTNYKTINASSDVTSLQSAYAEVLEIDTAAGDVNLNSLTNGSNGQRLTIVKKSAANNLVIKDNGAGTEKIVTGTGADVTMTAISAKQLICSNSVWYVV